ncbi:hypothetical protein Bhyg_07147 [Pseudolycoriella hygida]|uniref:Uncharacterized protein n=1 Tax=Pseudolycoriella hygida TaxID=35572 RepID=A0A9Q0N203_9DIPT|nr:hypothetical protein Bhyg_07147 [Pseudolycoriella hygida]
MKEIASVRVPTAVRNNENYVINYTKFCNENAPDWSKMISYSLATLDYFESHLDTIVADVAVGTRVMEAQLNILLNASLNLNETIQRDLKELRRKSNFVADSIFHHFTNNFNSPEYNEKPDIAKNNAA